MNYKTKCPNVWKNYASDKAEYAIGGPSLELIVKSYNQKYLEANIKFQIKDGTFVTDYSNRTGSVLAINGYSWSNKEGIWGTYFNNNIFNVSDNLYVISSIQKARGMWLSSPSGESTDCLVGIGSGNDGGGMMGVSYNAGGYGSPNQSYGLRPVVCLKSNVKLEEQSDNKYTI